MHMEFLGIVVGSIASYVLMHTFIDRCVKDPTIRRFKVEVSVLLSALIVWSGLMLMGLSSKYNHGTANNHIGDSRLASTPTSLKTLDVGSAYMNINNIRGY